MLHFHPFIFIYHLSFLITHVQPRDATTPTCVLLPCRTSPVLCSGLVGRGEPPARLLVKVLLQGWEHRAGGSELLAVKDRAAGTAVHRNPAAASPGHGSGSTPVAVKFLPKKRS